MATISFDTDLVIDTEKKAARFLEAIEEADKRGPMKFRDISAELRLGEELVKKGPIPMSRAAVRLSGSLSARL